MNLDNDLDTGEMPDIEVEMASLAMRDLADLLAMALGRRVSLRLRRRWARRAAT